MGKMKERDMNVDSSRVALGLITLSKHRVLVYDASVVQIIDNGSLSAKQARAYSTRNL